MEATPKEAAAFANKGAPLCYIFPTKIPKTKELSFSFCSRFCVCSHLQATSVGEMEYGVLQSWNKHTGLKFFLSVVIASPEMSKWGRFFFFGLICLVHSHYHRWNTKEKI